MGDAHLDPLLDRSPEQALQIATSLARWGWCCFPVDAHRRPTLKGWQTAATKNLGALRALWRARPGVLVGVSTGQPSGFDCLDLDAKHAPTVDAWLDSLPDGIFPADMRAYRTRSGGTHNLFRYREANGLRCWIGRPVPGVDIKTTGGYIVPWFAFGTEVLAQGPIPDWPSDLLARIKATPTRTATPARRSTGSRSTAATPRRIEGMLQKVRSARDGARNSMLSWACFQIAPLVASGWIRPDDAEARLIAAGMASGLDEAECRKVVEPKLRGVQRVRAPA